jgi:hypothetical protein
MLLQPSSSVETNNIINTRSGTTNYSDDDDVMVVTSTPA